MHPCLDNPHYQGVFIDTHTALNLSLANCSAVGGFLWHGILPGDNASNQTTLGLLRERLTNPRSTSTDHSTNFTTNFTDADNSTLRERFLRSASCACGACPATCRVCDKCYQVRE